MSAATLRLSHLTTTNYRTITNQEQSPFLQLPGEIRELIYTSAIGGSLIKPNYVRASTVPARLGRYRIAPAAVITIRTMVLSCRAIEAETEMLLYKYSIFIHELNYEWAQWVRLLGANKRRAIRMLTVPYAQFSAWKNQPLLPYRSRLDQLTKLKSIIVLAAHGYPASDEEKQAFQGYTQRRGCHVQFVGIPIGGLGPVF